MARTKQSARGAALKSMIGGLRKLEGQEYMDKKKSDKPCEECGKSPCECKENEVADEPANISGSY